MAKGGQYYMDPETGKRYTAKEWAERNKAKPAPKAKEAK